MGLAASRLAASPSSGSDPSPGVVHHVSRAAPGMIPRDGPPRLPLRQAVGPHRAEAGRVLLVKVPLGSTSCRRYPEAAAHRRWLGPHLRRCLRALPTVLPPGYRPPLVSLPRTAFRSELPYPQSHPGRSPGPPPISGSVFPSHPYGRPSSVPISRNPSRLPSYTLLPALRTLSASSKAGPCARCHPRTAAIAALPGSAASWASPPRLFQVLPTLSSPVRTLTGRPCS